MRRFFTALGLLLAACQSEPLSEASAPFVMQEVRVPFKAQIGEKSLHCGESYLIGTPPQQVQPRDFRLYLSSVYLINRKGKKVPLTLKQDGLWQAYDVALLDFENKSGTCQGNAPTNTQIVGQIPKDDYVGLGFQMGVPFGLNHQDVSLASSPFNSPSLFWNIRQGYQFARLDLLHAAWPDGFSIQVGSSGCHGNGNPISHVGYQVQHITGDEDPRAVPESCDAPNRVAVEFEKFDLNRHHVILDLGALLAGSDLSKGPLPNGKGFDPGCQSYPIDSDCTPIFHRLGLFFADQAGQDNVFFRKGDSTNELSLS